MSKDDRIDWQEIDRQRVKAAEQERLVAIGDLKAKVAMLTELQRLPSWQTLTEMLNNTANTYQQAAMKANDPTTLARAFGYMAAMRDVIDLPTSMAVQLESQLANLVT